MSDHGKGRRDLVVASGGDVRVGRDRLIVPDHVLAAGENNPCDPSQSGRLVNVVLADDVASVLALPILVSEVGGQMHYYLLPFKGGFDGLQICDVCLKACNSADGPLVKRR